MIASTESPAIGIAELARLVSAADPAALLVSPRLVRRVIKEDRDITGIGLQVPHRKTYVVARDALLASAQRDELGLPAGQELPDRVILLACHDGWLEKRTREQALVRYWRLLFHARIDQALDQQVAEGQLTEPTLRALVHRIGQAEFTEACQVLQHEDFLLPPPQHSLLAKSDLYTSFREFVALYWELKFFARPLLHRYFPAIEEPERVESILAEILDPEPLFRATRLSGAPDPTFHRVPEEEEELEGMPQKIAMPARVAAPAVCQKLIDRADQMAVRGNVARAAILRTRAALLAGAPSISRTGEKEGLSELALTALTGALADIDRLVNRLQAALELHERETEEWRATLPALLVPASHGLWPPSSRLLYDLQKACVDYERDIYAVDLVEWFVSLGHRPVKRFLPLQSAVLLVKHLRSAAARLGKARIEDEDRRRLAILLRSAIHHCEDRLRERLRPRLTDALEEVGLKPANYPEDVARRKLVEELLDRITERGFLRLGDVRDGLSRNQLKLSDMDGPVTFLLGDPLIRVNRKLAVALDGVYRRGEVYLRWLQRLSSLFFGTLIGRWLVLYLILPLGGAYASLIFLQEMAHLGHGAIDWLAGAPPSQPEPVVAATTVGLLATPDGVGPLTAAAGLYPGRLAAHPPDYTTPWTIGGVGLFLFLLLHVPRFRQRAAEVLGRIGRGLRVVLVDWPAHVLALPAVRHFLESRPIVFTRRYLMRPVFAALVATLVCRYFQASPTVTTIGAAGAFALTVLLFSSRLGRVAEEEATDWVARNWYWLRVDVLPGLFHLVMFFFKEFLDRVERVLYSVDEWLRFRAGDSKWSLVYKPVLGLIWFFVTYVIRVVINLMVEPTVNPIKHFPAVTVGAKVIVPLIPLIYAATVGVSQPFLEVVLPTGVAVGLAGFLAGMVVIWLPGVFGFVVWEFKENWKLYRANRPRALRPVMIGSHGETMLRFMKPGFHSGTLPKLHARIRRAERRGNGSALHRHLEALHHTKESIRYFVERELLMLLEGSRTWAGASLHVGAMIVGGNRVRVELCCPELDDEGAWVTFEEHAGWLLADVTRPGWLARLSPVQRQTFATALAGLYKLAGVTLVREQIESCLEDKGVPPYELDERGLVLWPGGDFSRKVSCVLSVPAGETEMPGHGAEEGQAVPRERLLFDRAPIVWDEWVAAWTLDQEGQPPLLPILEKVRLLPGSVAGTPADAASTPGPAGKILGVP